MKKVVVLSTGGTIASTPGSDGRNVSGAMPGEELVKKLQLGSEVDLEVHSVFQKPSNALTFDDLMHLREACIAFGQRTDVDGIVITHGTDTMEDTAYFLESTLELPEVTIVVTGSQRVPHAMGTDAYINLRNAIHVAMSSTVRELGVLVVFNESIYSAYTVRKVSSFQVNGFDAPGHGCLGWVDNDVVKLFQMPMRQTLIQPAAQLPRVDIMSASLGASAEAVSAIVESGASGLVLEGLGRGHIPPDWIPAVDQALEKGMTVLVCSSGLSGGIYQSYEFAGSLFDAERHGAIAVGDLTARKIRLRLMLLLGAGVKDRASIQAAFARTRSR